MYQSNDWKLVGLCINRFKRTEDSLDHISTTNKVKDWCRGKNIAVCGLANYSQTTVVVSSVTAWAWLSLFCGLGVISARLR